MRMKRSFLVFAVFLVFSGLAACDTSEPVVVQVSATPTLTPTPDPTQPFQATLNANQTQNALRELTRSVYADSAAATATIQALTPTATPLPTTTPVPPPPIAIAPITPQDNSLPGIGAPFAHSQSAIQEANLDQLIELARWGAGYINEVVFSGDGEMLVVATSTGIYLYDVDTLEPITSLRFFDAISALAISEDGSLMAVGFRGNQVEIFDLRSLEIVQAFGVQNYIWELAFVSDDRYLLSKSESYLPAEIWNLESRRFENLVEIVGGETDEALISVDGRTVLTFSEGEMQFWDWDTGPTGPRYPAYENFFSGIASSGEFFALAVDRESIEVFRVDNGELVWRGDVSCSECFRWFEIDDHYPGCEYGGWSGGMDALQRISFSPDGRFLITNYLGQTIIRDAADGHLVRQFGSGTRFAYSPGGALAAWGSLDGKVHLEVAATGAEMGRIAGFSDPVYDLEFEPLGNRLLIQYDDAFRIRSLADGGLFRTFEANHVTFSGDGSLIALAFAEGKIEIRDNFDLDLVHGYQIDSFPVQQVDFSHNGDSLFSVHDCRVFETDVRTRSTYPLVQILNGPASISITPDDENLLIFAGYEFRSFDLRSEEISGPVPISGAFWSSAQVLQGVGYYQDLSMLLQGPSPDSIAIDAAGDWDIVVGGALSPDGLLFATFTYNEGEIEVWSVLTGTLLARLTNSIGDVHSIAFSPDGRFLAVGSYRGTVSIWGIRP